MSSIFLWKILIIIFFQKYEPASIEGYDFKYHSCYLLALQTPF